MCFCFLWTAWKITKAEDENYPYGPIWKTTPLWHLHSLPCELRSRVTACEHACSTTWWCRWVQAGMEAAGRHRFGINVSLPHDQGFVHAFAFTRLLPLSVTFISLFWWGRQSFFTSCYHQRRYLSYNIKWIKLDAKTTCITWIWLWKKFTDREEINKNVDDRHFQVIRLYIYLIFFMLSCAQQSF